MRMSGVIKINGVELTISDNKSSDIALASFSGYLGFVGEIITQYGGSPGKTIGLVFDVSGGVITGVFDKNLNPQKEYSAIIGTALAGYGSTALGAWAGKAVAGLVAGSVAGPVGAIVGALVGGVFGGLYGDDIYTNGERLIKLLANELEEDFEFLDSNIIGEVSQKEFIIQSVQNDPNFCSRVFPEYKNYRQVVTIKNGTSSLADYLKYDASKQEAEIQVSNEETEKEALKTVTEETDAKKITINNETYTLHNQNDLTPLQLSNAVNDLNATNVYLSNVLLYTNEKLDIGDQGIYTIRSGDTLSDIATDHGMKTKALLELNPWLLDEGRVTFKDGTVLIKEGTILSDQLADALTGTSADDYLKDSNGGNDVLYGQEGNDTLIGGEGADVLNGGEGNDTYYTTKGDTIIDSDKHGSIYFGNELLGGVKKEVRVESGVFTDGIYTYVVENNDLTISKDYTDEYIIIENWQEESGLGITLEKKEPVDVQVFVGDATGREGENLVFNIELNTELEEDLSFDVKVEYTGDAWYGDVDEVRGTVTILAGEKQGTFSVPTKSDQKIENSEQFRLTPVGEYSYDGNDIKTLSMNSGVGLITDGTSLTNSRYQNTYYVGSVSCESPENWMGEEGCPGGQCYSAMVSEFDRGYSSGFGISTTPVYFEKTATWISYSLITYQYSNMISERYVTLDWTHRGTAGDYGIENWVFYDYSLDDFSMLSARGGHMSATGDQTSWSYKRDDEISENIPTNFSFNNSQKFEMFRNLLPQENSEDSTVRLPFEESINQMNKNFGLGTQTNDSMQGTRADETLRANAGDDIVNAGAGDDTVYGGQGSDSLSGGTGSDFLDGGEGDDLYIFNRNDGHDTLIESLGNDTLVFGEGIEQTDLIFVDKDEDLHVKVKNSVDEPTDIVTIKNWSQDSYRIENIRFSDGTTVDLALLKQQLNYAPELQNSEEHIILEDVLEISGQIVAYDLNEDTLTYTVASGSLYGQFSIDQATGDWHYFNETFVGEESVILQVDDGNGGSVKKVLTFETSITEPTITSPVQYTFDEDNTLNSSITVSNPSNSALVYEIVSVSKNGSSTLDEDGTLVYTPNSNYNGPDSITIKVINSYGLSTMQTIDLTVNAVNDAPEVTESQTTYQLSFINSIEGDIGAIDIDSEQLSYDVTSVPQYGTLTIKEDGTFSYETDGTFSGEDSAIIVIDDGEGGSVSKTLIFELDFGVLGTEEDDLLDQKNDKNDVVYAKGGDDEIHTGAGDDIVYGGEGDDIIYGGRGNDTYIFNRGDGEDTIYDIQDQNIVQFGETITEDDIAFVRTAMDELTVYVKDDNNDFRTTSDKIVFDDWFEKNNPENDVFRLADGTEIDVEYSFIVTESYDYVHLNGENNHTVDLLGGNDSAVVNNSEYIFIRGGEGNDTFYVEGGNNNIFDGEEGNDTFFLDSLNNSTVIGGKGDDSIRLKHSDGNHTLSSGEGDDDINISSSTGDYSVSTGDNNDRVNIYRHDGLLNIASGEGDDHLVVNSNNINFIDTGKGNDNVVIDSNGYLNTGEGNDNIKVTTSGYSLNLTVGISHNGYLEIVENISKLDTQNQIEITGGGWK
jgi:Ca2+-binding RTX toxin-like protein